MESFPSSSPFFIIREGHDHLNHQQQPPSPPPPPRQQPSNPQPPLPPAKKKRNVPGNPNPDAEVIALSPKTLMATNRFICEVCNKGFQREQNLQLHRRGHNLPWKLKQKSGKEVRRRVYLCPEPGCVHHDPSRALGDLTGVKKHFSRKHGEKKWKCDKCAKRYAVQSDCKAHSKTCGTREYRCDCGTLFSRRDSFITHRAFCDALAQDGAGHHAGLTAINGSHLYRNSDSSAISLGLSHLNSSHAHSSLHHQAQMHHPSPELLRLGVPAAVSGQNISLATQFDHLLPQSPHSFSFRPPHSAPFFLGDVEQHQTKPPFHGLMQFPGLQPNSSHNPSSNLYSLNYFSNGGSENANLLIHDQLNGGNLMNDDHIQCLFAASAQTDSAALPQMSATAMLQKAAQMGSTSNMGDQILRSQVENHERHLMDIMNSFANGGSGIFGGRPIDKEEDEEEEAKFGEFNAALCNMEEGNYQNNGLTRDFLGVGSLPRSVGRGMALDQHHHDMTNSSRSFHGGDYSSAGTGRGD